MMTSGNRTDLASNTPSNWTVTSNDGTNVVAVNSETNAIFSGPLTQFVSLFDQAVEVDETAFARKISISRLAELQLLGVPVPKGTILRDPSTGLMYGQSDGVGSFQPISGLSINTMWANRPHPGDVPAGTVINCPDVLFSSFVSRTLDGVAEWAPFGGRQQVIRWRGEVPCHTANTTYTSILTGQANGMVMPGGIGGLFGRFEVTLAFSQIFNTGGATYVLRYSPRFRNANKEGGVNDFIIGGLQSSLSVSTGQNEANKCAQTVKFAVSLHGWPTAITGSQIGPDTFSDGFQPTLFSFGTYADLELDIFTQANNAAISAVLVGVDVDVIG